MTDSAVEDQIATLMAATTLPVQPDVHAAPPVEPTAEPAACLLAGIARGEADALAALYKIWSPTLMGIALKILTDRTEAEECLQDTFVRVWRRAREYEPSRGTAFVWVFGILRGLCLDRLRFRSRLKRSAPFAGHEAAAEPAEAPQVIAADDLRQVHEIMATLEPAERECLQLAVLLEYSHTEIAARLQTPLGTVKNRLRRALTKLRTLFQHHES